MARPARSRPNRAAAAGAALIAGHDFVLLGERGQGKTRLLRTLVGMLDEWTLIIAGSELREHPSAPITDASAGWSPSKATTCRSTGAPQRAVRREARHPDTSVADLIGDVDPIRWPRAAGSVTRKPSTTG